MIAVHEDGVRSDVFDLPPLFNDFFLRDRDYEPDEEFCWSSSPPSPDPDGLLLVHEDDGLLFPKRRRVSSSGEHEWRRGVGADEGSAWRRPSRKRPHIPDTLARGLTKVETPIVKRPMPFEFGTSSVSAILENCVNSNCPMSYTVSEEGSVYGLPLTFQPMNEFLYRMLHNVVYAKDAEEHRIMVVFSRHRTFKSRGRMLKGISSLNLVSFELIRCFRERHEATSDMPWTAGIQCSVWVRGRRPQEHGRSLHEDLLSLIVPRLVASDPAHVRLSRDS